MKDTGGLVFPTGIKIGEESIIGGGMTLRDYFAGQALIGIWSNPDVIANVNNSTGNTGHDQKVIIGHMCYEQADAMIREMKG